MSYTVHHASATQAEYVILSSGLGGHRQFWAPQIPVLQQYFHVVTYDQEGCHHDSAALAEHYSVGHMAQQVLNLIQTLKISKFHFIGHALGGHIGLELSTLQAAHNFEILSLGLINAWGELDAHTQKCFATRRTLLNAAGADAYVRAQALFLYPPAYISKHHEKITQVENAQLLDFPPSHNVLARLNAVQNFALQDRHLTALEHVPVHLFANTDDFLVPFSQSKKLLEKIPTAQYHEFATGGHASTISEPEIMNKALLQALKN